MYKDYKKYFIKKSFYRSILVVTYKIEIVFRKQTLMTLEVKWFLRLLFKF